MNKTEAYNQIHKMGEAFANAFLTRAKVSGWICPKCGSGEGAKGTGMTLNESGEHEGRFKCWACGLQGDGVDLYQAMKGGDESEALREVCHALGIPLDEPPKKKPEEMTEEEKAAELARLIQADIKAAKLYQNDPAFIEYLTRRRIPLEIAKSFGLGFLPLWQNPKARAEGKRPPASPRLIIPTGKSSYLARDTRAEIPEAEDQYKKAKAGGGSLYHAEALTAKHPVFICEGEIDALSFYAVGAEAIGIGGTSGRAKLIEELQKRGRRRTEPLILALDNDEAGQKATDQLAAALDSIGFRWYYIRNPYGNHKDANEALVSDREAFAAAVYQAEGAEFDELTNLSALNWLREINRNPPPLVSTGFPQLDALLGGGIKGDELVFMGGVSSSGKSAFCLQVIDQVARQGRKCIIFSAEMSRKSIINRTLSRLTAEGQGFRYSASEVSGYGIEKTDRHYQEAMLTAYEEYAKFAGNIVVYDMENGSGGMKPNAIKAKITRFLNVHRAEPAPLVLVDYLQILPPEKDGGEIRSSINNAVEIFAGISHGLHVPLIVISSLSRENYTAPLNMSAFKESGNIEYGADIILGLQFERIRKDELFLRNDKGAFAEKWQALWEEKHRTPRKVEISLIKRRDGHGEGAVTFDYDARHNLFTENQTAEDFLSDNFGADEEGKKKARAMLTGHRHGAEEIPDEMKGTVYTRPAKTGRG